MNSTRTKLTSVLVLAAALGFAACGGSAMKGSASRSAPGAAPGAPEMAADQSPGAESEAPVARGEGYGGPVPAAAPPSSPGGAGAEAMRTTDVAKQAPSPNLRPGLGTEWGETRSSHVTTSAFVRGDPNTPFAVARVFYNDQAGISAMVDQSGGTPTSLTVFPVWSGYVDVAVRSESGVLLPGLSLGGNNYVTGEAGRRYSIVIRNHSPGRIEVVASVDGLDVIDGKTAGYPKRGYLLDPHGTLEIEGFRQSESQVAAFRFGAVSQSYAERKHGETRNVGVIGVAFFHEQGDSPSFWGDPSRYQDATRRHQADPFPQYATPPPR